jgi:hypothetical protein
MTRDENRGFGRFMKLSFQVRRSLATAVIATILCGVNGAISAVSAEAPPSGKDAALAAHLPNRWISAAGLALNTEKGVIFYHGSAQHTSGGTEPWRGTVQGGILYVSKFTAMVIPDGTLTVGCKEALKVVGPHYTFWTTPGKQPAWLGLLAD